MEKIFEDFKAVVKSSGARIYKSGIEGCGMIDDKKDRWVTGTKLWVSVCTNKFYNDGIIFNWCKENGYHCNVDGTEKTIIYSIFIEDYKPSEDDFNELNEYVVDLVNNKYKDKILKLCNTYKELFDSGHIDLRIYHPFKEVLFNIFNDIKNIGKFNRWIATDKYDGSYEDFYVYFSLNNLNCFDCDLPGIYSVVYDDFYAEVRFKLEEYFFFDTEDTDLMYIESYNK